MGKRGPKPKDKKNIEKLEVRVKKPPKPPKRLGKIAKKLWKEITTTLPADHFKKSDLPLLEKYCMAEELYWRAQGQLSENLIITTEKGYTLPDTFVTIMNQQVKLQTTLATKLRICPNARISNFKAAGEKETAKSSKWEGLRFGDK